MFITLQFPFVDLRRFLRYPPDFVPNRPNILNPGILDFERIAATEYVRSFGHYRLRGYVPNFNSERKYHTDEEDDWRLLNLRDIWQDEYLYASTRRALRFEALEKQQLLGGRLSRPRAKIRALRFSPFDSTNSLWSPCMRIETGILYHTPNPLEGNELVRALTEFMKLKVNVPVFEKDGAGRNAVVKKQLLKGVLFDQQLNLAKLIVNGTTAQNALRVHDNMILPGQPLLSVHYNADELASLPENVIPLPKALTRNAKISYHPLKGPRIGLWLFEVPSGFTKRKILVKKRETIRNNTIAIMRYWSELQAIIALRGAVATDSFEFVLKENKQMQDYVNNATKFLLSGSWHGADLDIIRNIISAHQLIAPDRQPQIDKTLKDFKRQIAEKLLAIGTVSPNIFVSYSHLDKEFLPALQNAFTTISKTQQIAYFDDTYIEAGEEWEQRIIHSLENASVAILLVSDNFLASQYVKTVERPKIVERYQRGKLTIIPILIDGEVPKQGFFSGLQFLNGNTPFSQSTEIEKTKTIELLIKKISSGVVTD